jgi:hypothetical protein
MFRWNGALRRGLMTAAVAAVVAAAVGGVSLARAGSSGDRTLRVKEVQTGSVFVNVTHSQHGAPGDEFIFHAKLLKAGNTVGTLDAMCTLVLHNRLQCEGTAHLRGGTLALEAGVSSNASDGGTTRVAITGGTGRYDHAHGELISTSTGQNTARDVFDIDL